MSLQKTPAYGEPKIPRIWLFLDEGFRMAFCFFSESLWLSHCAKLANRIRNPPTAGPGQTKQRPSFDEIQEHLLVVEDHLGLEA
jgi:hypothetical protein